MESAATCSICLDRAQRPAIPSGCRHVFCLLCLQEWCAVTNLCPLCKCRFASIQTQGRTLPVKHRDQQVEPDESVADVSAYIETVEEQLNSVIDESEDEYDYNDGFLVLEDDVMEVPESRSTSPRRHRGRLRRAADDAAVHSLRRRQRTSANTQALEVPRQNPTRRRRRAISDSEEDEEDEKEVPPTAQVPASPSPSPEPNPLAHLFSPPIARRPIDAEVRRLVVPESPEVRLERAARAKRASNDGARLHFRRFQDLRNSLSAPVNRPLDNAKEHNESLQGRRLTVADGGDGVDERLEACEGTSGVQNSRFFAATSSRPTRERVPLRIYELLDSRLATYDIHRRR